ncbi:MAG: SsgA family sporulation/cell division regulator [Pseudonocardiaceae bacterium]
MPTARPFSTTARLHTPTGQQLPAVWAYDPADPLAVALHIRSPEPVCWIFARDLLHAGLHTRVPVGDGDIRLWTTPTHGNPTQLVIELDSPTGHAHLSTGWEAVAAFCRRAHTTVPTSRETTLIARQLDHALTQLQGDAR